MTAGLLAIRHKGQMVVAQYVCPDAEPKYLGVQLLHHLSTISHNHLIESLPKVQHLADAAYFSMVLKHIPKNVFLAQGNAIEQGLQALHFAHPTLSPLCGAKFLRYLIVKDHTVYVLPSHAFALNGQKCHWAYLIDFDQGAFEVYRGGITGPVPSPETLLLAGPPIHVNYPPVQFLESWELVELPTPAQFLADISAALKKPPLAPTGPYVSVAP